MMQKTNSEKSSPTTSRVDSRAGNSGNQSRSAAGVPHVSLRAVKREFADNTGLHSTDLDFHKGEFISILGPSGCGKSTLLRCIAGLETPDSGRIVLAGREVYGDKTNVPVNKRKLSMVFQDLALWPHMSVAKNIEFPLTTKGSRASAKERSEAVQRAMKMVGISDKAKAKPAQLSGGQQQRVAIARALVSSPDVLLMDEPLSALDAALREQIRAELTALARELDLTVIYVTHNQAEALAMSDRVVVMNKGVVEQVADPVTLYEQPATEFVAGFVGTMNRHETLPSIRPENVAVYADRAAAENAADGDEFAVVKQLQARVISSSYVGGRYEIRCSVDGGVGAWTVYSRQKFDIGAEIVLVPQYSDSPRTDPATHS